MQSSVYELIATKNKFSTEKMLQHKIELDIFKCFVINMKRKRGEGECQKHT